VGSSFTVEAQDAALAQTMRERLGRVVRRRLPAVEPLGRSRYAVSLPVDRRRPELLPLLLACVRDVIDEAHVPAARLWSRGMPVDVEAGSTDPELEQLARRLAAESGRRPKHLPGVPFS